MSAAETGMVTGCRVPWKPTGCYGGRQWYKDYWRVVAWKKILLRDWREGSCF